MLDGRAIMTDAALLGPWIRRFLLEYLVTERNLARNTQRSYRDTLCLLLPFAAGNTRKEIDQLTVIDVSADLIRLFLQNLEQVRKCGTATRNQRLAAIHSLSRYIGLHSPEHVAWCGQIRVIPSKRAPRSCITYLEKYEMDALLDAPDKSTEQGRRDYALLLFLYNTGARADEAAHAKIGDLTLAKARTKEHSLVQVHGKGDRLRRCPLWPQTVAELAPLIGSRSNTGHVFLNRRGEPITRFGIHTMVERYIQKISPLIPSLTNKRVSPHTIRHTTATHLLRAGVDINTIRAWLGHVSLNTTNVYAEVDLEMKAKALATCEIKADKVQKHWRGDSGLLRFLQEL
jgi:site-specific recombinase XerD